MKIGNAGNWIGQLRDWWQHLWGSATDSCRRIGARAEAAAARYLKRRGYRILERNLRTRIGEIDIVATHDDWLVVVEVRSRREDSPVSPRETLTRQKQRKLRAVIISQRGKVKSCQLLPGLALEER